MYRPLHFIEDRPEVLRAAIARHPLATVVSAGAEGLTASHLPMLLREEDEGPVLEGHFARANPHWQAIAAGAETLILFQGEAAYVSPGWYATKRETGKVVPTWNYVVVEARGEMALFEDPDALLRHVSALSGEHERAQPEPWAVTDAPERFIAQLLRAIVGVRMRVARLEGKWKLSQNRPEADQAGVVAGLRGLGRSEAVAMAETMARLGRAGE